jgi:glucose-1-phosphate thymidylyltransferase
LKGIVLHGGAGTRLRPLTHTGPKQLIPVANKPISQHVLEDLKEAGIKDVAIVLGDLFPEKVVDKYGNGEALDLKITYVRQGEPKGIAHAIGLCEGFVGASPFTVYLGDNLLKGGINKVTKEFESSQLDCMVLLCKVKDPERFGVAEFDAQGRLVKLVEKPKKPLSKYALTGIYFFRPVIFDAIKQLKPSWRGELEITEAIQHLLENKLDVGYRFVESWWKDTGTPEDILESNRLILDELQPDIRGDVEDERSIQGRVAIGEKSRIGKGALVRGPAVIGYGTVIDPQVYIGPYTSIGNNVRITRGEIENSIIMDNCYIEVNEKITESLIGPNSKITGNQSGPKGTKLIIGESSVVTL